MSKGYTQQELIHARSADLYEFLLNTEPYNWDRIDRTIRMHDPESGERKNIVVCEDSNRYIDYDENKNGDAISFLTDYRSYAFADAVKALSSPGVVLVSGEDKSARISPDEVSFPVKSRTNRQLYAYLCSKGIPSGTIAELIGRGLLYQSDGYNNAVFINPDKTFAEICGTNGYAKKPYRNLVEKSPDGFWYFSAGPEQPEAAYICEGAIDAVSLREYLRLKNGKEENAFFCAIYSADRQEKINCIKEALPVTFALKKGKDSEACLERNEGCGSISPTRESWNEELLKGPAEQ